MNKSQLWAVLPIKESRHAKQRLSPVLTAQEREDLTRAMTQDVLVALTAASGLAGIIVVGCTGVANAFAQQFGAVFIDAKTDSGQSHAVGVAADWLAREKVEGMLVVPVDVPKISPADIEAILASHGCRPAVTVIPAVVDGGTNGLACSPVDVITPLFGPASLNKHCTAAKARGIDAHVLALENWIHDIDRPEDLVSFAKVPSPTRTYDYLSASGIIARLERLTPTSVEP